MLMNTKYLSTSTAILIMIITNMHTLILELSPGESIPIIIRTTGTHTHMPIPRISTTGTLTRRMHWRQENKYPFHPIPMLTIRMP